MYNNDLLELTHEEQQQAVEEIQKLVQNGMSHGEAITTIAQNLRKMKEQPSSEGNYTE